MYVMEYVMDKARSHACACWRWHRHVAALAFVSLALGLAAAGESAAGERLRIIHFNDIDSAAALPALATAIRQSREEADGMVRVTHGGGMLAPTLLSSLDQGRHMVRLMNNLGLDIAVPGSHEFDFGESVLEERIGESEFWWLSSNLSPNLKGATDYNLFSVGQYLVGVIGLTTTRTPTTSSPDKDTKFRDPLEVAKTMAMQFRERNVDLLIAVAHVDRDVDLALLEHVDVVLSGRDNWLDARFDGQGLLVQTEPLGRQLAVVDLYLDSVESNGERQFVWTPSIHFRSARGLALDSSSLDIIREAEADVPQALEELVGVALASFDTRHPEHARGENSFGNLVADAIRNQTGAEVAIVNSGSLQGERVYGTGMVITLRDLRKELPYANQVSVLSVSGATLLEALENGVSEVERDAGRFPQVSGFRYSFDPSAPAGSRIRTVTVAGEPLDPARMYSLATNEFLARGGDGYESLLKAGPARHTSVSVIDAVVEWTEQRGGFRGGLEGRIRILP